MLRGPGNRQHVVERHRHVGDYDLGDRLTQGLLPDTGDHRLDSMAFERLLERLLGSVVSGSRVMQFLPHLPADPEQQKPASKKTSSTICSS